MKEQIEDLIAEWRTKAGECRKMGCEQKRDFDRQRLHGKASAFTACADDLERATPALLARVEALERVAEYAEHSPLCTGRPTEDGALCECGVREAFAALNALASSGAGEGQGERKEG